jgi:hypothetical protein
MTTTNLIDGFSDLGDAMALNEPFLKVGLDDCQSTVFSALRIERTGSLA